MVLKQEIPSWSAGAGAPAPLATKQKGPRRAYYWPLAIVVIFLACLAGCQYNISRFAKFISGSSVMTEFGPKAPNAVGVLLLEGPITNSIWTTGLLAQFREYDNIKAVVVRIDSPGGSVGPCQEIYNEVAKLAKVKPVIVSMGSMAASGGLYVAAAGDKVVANQGTVTGSIGVIMQSLNFRGTLDKIGAESMVIKSGPYKDIGSPFKKMSSEEEAFLQATVDILHDQFVADLAKGRDMPEDEVRAFANGRIFSGLEARSLGLVDELGGFEDALRLAARAGNMPVDKRPQLVIKDGRGPWWRILAESRAGAALGLGVSPAVGKVNFQYIYQPGF